MNSELKNKQVAKAVREASKRVRESGVKCRDKDLKNAYFSDARDLRKVASLMAAGDIGGSIQKAERLDTIVRDWLPDEFWNFADAWSECHVQVS